MMTMILTMLMDGTAGGGGGLIHYGTQVKKKPERNPNLEKCPNVVCSKPFTCKLKGTGFAVNRS